MRIFIAGASGAVGQPLVRQLTEAGHEVIGMTRTPAKAARLQELGAQPVVADALDRDAVIAAVTQARPDVVVHQLTAIATMGRPKSSTPMQVARQRERAPAALRPWVVTRERRAGTLVSSRSGSRPGPLRGVERTARVDATIPSEVDRRTTYAPVAP